MSLSGWGFVRVCRVEGLGLGHVGYVGYAGFRVSSWGYVEVS